MDNDNRNKLDRFIKPRFNKRKISSVANRVENATIRHAHKFLIRRWKNIRDVQWHIIVWVMVMGFLIVVTGLQLMWYQDSYMTTSYDRDGTYAEAVLGPIETLNPIYASTSAEQSASRLIFSSIMQYDTTGRINYDLASSVTVNDDRTIYNVVIRQDVKWHDGVLLTASDIAFTLDLIKNSNTRSVISGWKDIEVKQIDDFTIQFKLLSPFVAFYDALTFPILPKHILKDVAPIDLRENSFSQSPVGSGPFKFKLLQVSDKATKTVYMSRNDDYYRGLAHLARLQLHAYDTTDDIIKALSSKEVNAAADLSAVDIESIDTNKYTVVSRPIQSGVYAIMNTSSPLLKDLDIRKALRLAVDTEAIRDKLDTNNQPLYLPFICSQLRGDKPDTPIYDVDKAKKTLVDDGWVESDDGIMEKDGQPLQITIVALKNNEFEKVLEVLVGQWHAIGVDVKTNILDPNDVSQNAVQNTIQPRNYDVLLYQLNIGADPDVYAYWHSSQATEQGYNLANYSNIISDDALTSARTKIDIDLRNAKYLTFAKQWLNDVPAIGLYQSSVQYVESKSTESIHDEVLVSPTDRYNNVINWSIGKRMVYTTP